MQGAFEIDVLACPRCGGRLRLIATVEDPRAIREVLDALAFSTEALDRAAAPPVGRRHFPGRRLRLIATAPGGRLGRGSTRMASGGPPP